MILNVALFSFMSRFDGAEERLLTGSFFLTTTYWYITGHRMSVLIDFSLYLDFYSPFFQTEARWIGTVANARLVACWFAIMADV